MSTADFSEFPSGESLLLLHANGTAITTTARNNQITKVGIFLNIAAPIVSLEGARITQSTTLATPLFGNFGASDTSG